MLIHLLRYPGVKCADLEAGTEHVWKSKGCQKKHHKALLDEIYAIRKQEEAFLRGEIGRFVLNLTSIEVLLISSS